MDSSYPARLLFLFLICMLLSQPVTAQTRNIDSLKNELSLHPAEDTLQANILIALCNAYVRETNDVLIIHKYWPKLMAISQKLKFKKGIATAYYNMGLTSTGKSDFDIAIHYFFKGLTLFKETGNKKGESACLHNIGNVKNNQGNYSEAIQYSLKAAKIREEIGDKVGTASSYNNIGVTYYYIGDYSQALKYFFKSLKIKEEVHDDLGISFSFLNIGSVFYDLGNYKEALQYKEKALALKIKLGDKAGEAMIYNFLASMNVTQKNYAAALAYNFKSLKLREEIKDKQGINMSLTYIGDTYIAQNKFNEALGYYAKGLKSALELGDNLNTVNCYNGIGNSLEGKGLHTEAVSNYKKALEASTGTNYKLGMMNSYLNLASANEKIQHYKEALEYNKLYNNIKDTLLNEKSLKQTSELNARYDVDKKEKEILILTKDQQLKDKSLKEQRLVRIGLMIGLGLFLFLSFLLYNRYRFKQKANLVLEKQKAEIHHKNVLITDSIDYAKTIQEAILPDEEQLGDCFQDYFILYKPKAIVSGDFYWIRKSGDIIYCAVADCTGHGVPGAFMSLLGYNILENNILNNSTMHPGDVLGKLNHDIVNRFSKGKIKEDVKHAMDIALIQIDSSRKQLQYAGAKNSLYHVRENQLTEIKADKRSTGITGKGQEAVTYTNHHLEIRKDDVLYLFSDGFPDQKGGPDQKKFFYQPFKDLLVSIHHLPLNEQKERLDTIIMNWIGDNEQIDDILIMGIRL